MNTIKILSGKHMHAQSVELGSETRGARVRGDDILARGVLRIGAASESITAGRPEKKTVPGVSGGEDWGL